MTKNDFSWPDDDKDDASWSDDNDEEFSWPDDDDEEEAEFDPGCGFSVVCRPTQSAESDADSDADAETVTVAIPRKLMIDLLFEMQNVEWSAEQIEAATAFFNRLADSDDAEYRLQAAASPLLREDAALKLLQDPAHDVRKALAENVDAQALVPLNDRLLLSEKDVDVREAMLESALKAWEKVCRQDEDLASTRRKEAEALATESLHHASPNVCDVAAGVLEKLEKNEPAAPANDTSWWTLHFWDLHKQSARFEELLAARSRWAFFLVEDDADEEEGAELPLPYPALDKLANTLAISEFHDGALLLERLACHPDRFIRATVARRNDVPIEVYARFKTETDYVVRKALLTNPNALEVMSEETMERLVGNDPMLLCEAYKQTESDKLDELMTKLYGFWGENGDKMVEALKSKKIGDAVDQALDEF